MSNIKVGKDDVDLNSDLLKFSPETINEFLSTYASLYRYYSNKHNDAAYIVKKYSDSYAAAINRKFKESKEANGYSDKMAEACSKSDPENMAILERVRTAEYAKDELYSFLRSMDAAHSDAKEMCYNLRKEMDKIYPKTISKLEDDAY